MQPFEVTAAGLQNSAVQSFDIPEIDAALPGGGLLKACLHEIVGGAAALGFAAMLAGIFLKDQSSDALVFWGRLSKIVSEVGILNANGLVFFGLDPARLIFFEAKRQNDLLWSIEEALRSGYPAVVVGEIEKINFASSRRLQLAAKYGSVTALLISYTSENLELRKTRTKKKSCGLATPVIGLTATRWQVTPFLAGSSYEENLNWCADLTYCKGAQPCSWIMSWYYKNKYLKARRCKFKK